MTPRVARKVFALFVATFVLTLNTTAAIASHNQNGYYYYKWRTLSATNEDKVPQWRFTGDIPGNDVTDPWRARILAGSHAWNDIPPANNMRFDFVGGDSASLEWDTACENLTWPYQDDRVGKGDLNPGQQDAKLAKTKECHYISYNTMYLFRIKFSNDYDGTWFTGSTGSNIGPTQNDVQSVAAHEFGHATGRNSPDPYDGHFLETDNVACPGNGAGGPDYSTMCPSTPTGTYGGRFLESHDISAFNSAYP